MCGLARLCAAVTVSWLPKDKQEQNHPHGLGNIWSWIAGTMNTEPVEDVTASIMYDVLTVAGCDLYEQYGTHFKKLLMLLRDEYLPRIRALNPDGWGAPIERLETFVNKSINEGKIKKPEKQLPREFL